MLVHASGSGLTNVTTSPAINITGANIIYVAIAGAPGPMVDANLSDSAGNSWASASNFTIADGSGAACGLFWITNPTTSTSYTLTYNSGGGSLVAAASVIAASGWTADEGLHSTNTGSGVTTLSPGSITPTVTGDLIIAALESNGTAISSVSINSGFNILDNVPFTSGNNYGLVSAYLIDSSATAINPAFSWTNSVTCSALQNAAKGSFTTANCPRTLTTLGVGCSLGDAAAAYGAYRLIKNPRISRRGFIKGWTE